MTPPHALLEASLPHLVLFVLALARVAGLVMLAPIFGARIAPVRVRAALAFFMAVAMLPLVPPPTDAFVASGPLALAGAIGLQTALGLTIGLVAQLVFGGVQMAGQLAGIQMGLGLANLIDPQTQEHVTALAQWQDLIALLVFLAVDGHHLLIRALAESFSVLPLGGGFPSIAGLGMVVTLAGGVFVIALKLAAPVIVLLLLVNAAMGVLSKLIPQLNVFIVGFPLNVGAGLVVLAAAQPYMIRALVGAFDDMGRSLAAVLRALG